MTPEIIAHRGGAQLWPENSLLACRGALALGVDQVQVDVHLAADRKVVVVHDASLDRTTEGRGPVQDRSWAELAKIRLKNATGETVPSLAAVARVLHAGNARLRLELKRAPGAACSNLPEHVVEVLEQTGMMARTIITSFDPADLQRARVLAPGIPLALLLDASATVAWSGSTADAARRIGCSTICVRYDRLTTAFGMNRIMTGLRLCCFGANDAPALNASFAVGPDEISTDRPDLALRMRR